MTACTDSRTLRARPTSAYLLMHNSVTQWNYSHGLGKHIQSTERARFERLARFSEKPFQDLMTALEDPGFPYDFPGSSHGPFSKLPRECPQSIRLVKLHPASKAYAPIECSFYVDTLENNPQYVALSYTGGRYFHELDIVLSDGRVQVPNVTYTQIECKFL